MSSSSSRSRAWAGVPLALTLACTLAACGAAPGSARSSGRHSSAASAGASATSSASGPQGSKEGGSSTAAGPTWSGLGTRRPLWIQDSQPGLAAAPVAQPEDLALCLTGSGGGIDLSRNGGAGWTTVATSGVVAATARSQYPVVPGGEGAPACTTAVADPAHPGTVYATFAAGSAKYGMPPVYSVPLYTTDAGAAWHVVPPPSGASLGTFGQFAVSGDTVLAVFGPAATGGASTLVTATGDGGGSWRAASLSCPAGGPCVTWGPAASGTGSCAMHAYPQAVDRSTDGGRTWSAQLLGAGGPGSVLANSCSPNQLVAVGQAQVLLIANGTGVPQDAVRLSVDGGRIWRPVALPPLPTGAQAAPGGLRMLPDGTLLQATTSSTGSSLPVRLLAPGATTWCRARGLALPADAVNANSLEVVGQRLWWIATTPQGQGASARSTPLAGVHC